MIAVIIAVVAANAVSEMGSANKDPAVIAMKSDLRNLVTAQEAHRADSGRYASETNLLSAFAPSNGVSAGSSLLAKTP